MSTLDITRVVQRWESLGLLEGLPRWEKEELSQMFEVSTKVMLHRNSHKPPEVVDMCENVIFPTLRRLYRRVGINVDIENAISTLISKVEESIEELKTPISKEKNPIIEFCVEFADTYEDDITSINQLTDEQYEGRVLKSLDYLKQVLLSKDMVSYVSRDSENWEVKYSEHKKSTTQLRMWNQKVVMKMLETILKDTNKGI